MRLWVVDFPDTNSVKKNRDSGAMETYIPDAETAFEWLDYHS